MHRGKNCRAAGENYWPQERMNRRIAHEPETDEAYLLQNLLYFKSSCCNARAADKDRLNAKDAK